MRGKKAVGAVKGRQTERYSIIAGLCGKAIKAPFVFKGNTNSGTFNRWLEEFLLPELDKGTTLVMDKASFHKTDKTRQLIEAAGCELLYLPTYSPDLNPIENYWPITKSRLKSKMFIYKKTLSNIHAALKCNVAIS
jgi:transposase